MTITLYIMRRRRIFFQGKGTTFTKKHEKIQMKKKSEEKIKFLHRSKTSKNSIFGETKIDR